MFRFSLDLHNLSNPLTKLIFFDTSDSHNNVFAAYDFQTYFIKPASPIMYGIADLHDFIMIYLVFIVFFVTFMLFLILKDSTINELNEVAKFKKVKKLYNVKFNHHSTLETIWIVIPSLILLSIAIPSFIILYAMDIIPGHDFSIKVIGHQWYWSYEYIMKNIYAISYETDYKHSMDLSTIQDKETLHRYSFDSYMIPSDELKDNQLRLLDTTNPLVLPIARYASVTVTSVDVIHSFAVPSLGIKVDAIPGRLNTVAMYIMELGHYYGQCSELCGVNHGFMPIEIYCVDIVGFTIYKAILSSKLVTKDIVSKNVEFWDILNIVYENDVKKYIFEKKYKDVVLANKTVEAHKKIQDHMLKVTNLSRKKYDQDYRIACYRKRELLELQMQIFLFEKGRFWTKFTKMVNILDVYRQKNMKHFGVSSCTKARELSFLSKLVKANELYKEAYNVSAFKN